MSDERPTLKVSTEWVDLTVTGPPTVVNSYRGYLPVLPVKDNERDFDYYMYISAKSLAEQLEPLREKNGGKFEGMKFWIKKESEDKFAPYVISDANPAG